jgi:hypothetical protein
LNGREVEEENISGSWMGFSEKIRYWELKEEALGVTARRTCFGGG